MVLLLVAFNLRTAITSVSPVLVDIERSLGLDGASAGVLTALPVLCLAFFAPVSAKAVRRWGSDRTIAWALLTQVLGLVLRLGGSNVVALYAGTLLAGMGIAMVNAVLPSIVNARYPSRSGAVVGLYVMSLGMGAAVASGVSVPLAQVLGGWPASLAVWAGPALLALFGWVSLTRLARRGGTTSSEPDAGPALDRPQGLPWRSRTAWHISIYLALQAFVYYSVVAWFAPSYEALGWSATRAGLLFSVVSLVQVVAAPIVPALAAKRLDRRPFFWASASLALVGIIGVVAIPTFAPWPTACVLGIGIGGLFPLGVTLLVDHAADPGASARLSAMAFLFTYLVAASGPVLLGGLHDATGSFETGWVVVAAFMAAVIVSVSWLTPHRRAIARQGGM
ncbi:MAG: MFS transporter [Acidimicrobiales bacterium]